MADWRDRLVPASFRGVPFKVEADEGTVGRRVQVHEYPNRDKPYTEDMGRATGRFTIQAYLIGDDYFDQRDRLIAAVNAPGPATLSHPYYGEVIVCVDGNVRVSHDGREGRMCRVSMSFVEAGELSFPTAGIATDQQIISSCSVLDEASETAFKSFSLNGLPDFIQGGVLTDAADMLQVIIKKLDMLDAGVAAGMRLLQGDLSVILMPPSDGNDFVRTLQRAWRSGTRFIDDSGQLVRMVKTISGITLDPGLAPRGVRPGDSATTRQRRIQSNYIAQAIRNSSLSEAAYRTAILPRPPARTAEAEQKIFHPALSVLPAAVMPLYLGWDDLSEISRAFNAASNRELMRSIDDAVFQAITSIRTHVNTDIAARLAQTDRTVERVPSDLLPALVLAADWYDNAARASDIVERNRIAHPGFVPVKPLRVPAR